MMAVLKDRSCLGQKNREFSRRSLRFETLEERQLLTVEAGSLADLCAIDGPLVAAETASTIVTTASDVISSTDGLISLREAISYASTGGKVTFSSAMNGKVITLGGTWIKLASNITIDATSLSQGVTISGVNTSGIFYVSGVSATMKNLNLIKGKSTAGAGVYNDSGTVTMTNCSVSQCVAAQAGGGLYNYSGTFTINGCKITNNSAGNAGGIWNFNGNFNITSCVITGNYGSDFCGGCGNGSGTMKISNSLIANNSTDGYGGAIRNRETLSIYNSTITSNTAKKYGGGIYNDGSAYSTNLYNSILVLDTANLGSNEIFDEIGGGSSASYYSLSSFTDWNTRQSAFVYSASSPLFQNALSGDYSLAEDSQAIDVGLSRYAIDALGNTLSQDLSGTDRIIGSKVDLGAYEYHSTTIDFTVSDYQGIYDGVYHEVEISGIKIGDSVVFSSDGINFATREPTYKNVGYYSVYVRVSRTGYLTTTRMAMIKILPKSVTVTIDVDDKPYDGGTQASGTYTLTGLVNNEKVTLKDGAYFFEDSEVGINKTVTFAGYSLSSSNYTLVNATASDKASITRRQLTISGTSVSDKIYDGTNTASVTLGTVSGIVNNDDVTISAVGFFDSAEVGDRTATVVYMISGTNADRYIAPNYETMAARIISSTPLETPANLTVSSGGGTSHLLTWNAVVNASSYEAAYSVDGQYWATVTVQTPSCVISDLTYGALMIYKVKALGNGIYADSAYSETESLRVCPMDMNSDGSIALLDYVIFSSAWQLTSESEDWDPRADIDGNGRVNLKDYIYLSQNWQKKSDDSDLVYPAASALVSDALFDNSFEETTDKSIDSLMVDLSPWE